MSQRLFTVALAGAFLVGVFEPLPLGAQQHTTSVTIEAEPKTAPTQAAPPAEAEPAELVDPELAAYQRKVDLYNRRAIEAIQHRQYETARDILHQAIGEAPEEPVLYYNLGCVEALDGKPTVAISALSNAVDLGFNDIELMNNDKDLDSLRKMPEFRKLYQIVASNSLAAQPNGGPEVADIYKMEPGEGVKEQHAPEPVKQ